MKSIYRAALLNDNAPDSEFYLTRVHVQLGAAIFDFYIIFDKLIKMLENFWREFQEMLEKIVTIFR